MLYTSICSPPNKYGEMTVELKCSSGYLVDHERSISTGCGSLPYTSIENIFNTREPYGKSKISKEQDNLQDLTTSVKLYENDSSQRVCFAAQQFLFCRLCLTNAAVPVE